MVAGPAWDLGASCSCDVGARAVAVSARCLFSAAAHALVATGKGALRRLRHRGFVGPPRLPYPAHASTSRIPVEGCPAQRRLAPGSRTRPHRLAFQRRRTHARRTHTCTHLSHTQSQSPPYTSPAGVPCTICQPPRREPTHSVSASARHAAQCGFTISPSSVSDGATRLSVRTRSRSHRTRIRSVHVHARAPIPILQPARAKAPAVAGKPSHEAPLSRSRHACMSSTQAQRP